MQYAILCYNDEKAVGAWPRHWDALLANGGKPVACGWVTDRYGLRWQIAPSVLGGMIADPDRSKAKRATEEMLKQVKLDIARLEAAFHGR
jgi:predicted 3-demethylubiquinone-9 3-methyltransferase (glyoxalase superfamily)